MTADQIRHSHSTDDPGKSDPAEQRPSIEQDSLAEYAARYRESQARFEALTENLPFDFWMIGANGRYVMQNSLSKELWGDVTGLLPEEVGVDEQTLALWQDNNRRARSGEIVRQEVQYRVHGEQRHLLNVIASVQDGESALGLVGVNVDITDRVETEQRLQEAHDALERRVTARTAELAKANARLHEALEQQRALASIVNQSLVVVFRYRATPPHEVVYVSENIRLFGYTPEEFTAGRISWRDITHPEDLRQLVTELDGGVANVTPERHSEYRIKTRCGEYRWIDERTFPLLDSAGQCTHYQGIVLDITDRHKTQQALLRSERMAAVGLLATGVAHEFNNVHTSMMGFIELALESADLPRSAGDKLRRAIRIGQRAAEITQNLLSYTRTAHAAHRSHDIEQVIQDSVGSLRPELDNARIEVLLETQATPPVLLDRALISQLLRNLLINATHALLSRDAPRITISSEVLDNHCLVTVSDNGIGIPEEHLSKLFLPFFSTKGERAPAGSPLEAVQGTGLGLSVCEAIAHNHGGELTVESTPDQGASFTLRLPLA